MVTYSSQYRKHYKSPHWDDFAVREYSRKLDYRIGRRSVEHQHQPWCWDSEDEKKHEPELLEKSSSKEIKKRYQTPTVNHRKETSDEEDKGTKDAAEEPAPNTKQNQKENSMTRPRKTRRRRRASESKSKREVSTSKQKEPFVSYGWANEGPIEKKYTYNVKASPKEVYPAALRALKRRELEVRRKLLENQEKAARKQELMKEKFFNHGHMSPLFLTEYQRSYCFQNDVKTGYVW